MVLHALLDGARQGSIVVEEDAEMYAASFAFVAFQPSCIELPMRLRMVRSQNYPQHKTQNPKP